MTGAKRAKIVEIKGCGASFWVYKGLVVVVRKGCEGFRRSESIIFDIGGRLRSYFFKGRGFW